MFLFEMGKDDNLMCPTAPPQKIQNSRFISTKQYGHVSDSWLINSMDNETRKYFLFYYLTHGILSAAKKNTLMLVFGNTAEHFEIQGALHALHELRQEMNVTKKILQLMRHFQRSI